MDNDKKSITSLKQQLAKINNSLNHMDNDLKKRIIGLKQNLGKINNTLNYIKITMFGMCAIILLQMIFYLMA